MKVRILLFLLFFSCSLSKAQDYDLQMIRATFFNLTFDSKNTPAFYDQLQTIEDPMPIIKAYLGATQALMVKHVWSPFGKWKYLRMSEKTLTEAVNNSPKNVEIRFIRFSVEKNIPHMFGFSEHLEGDKAYILDNIKRFDVSDLDEDYLDYIINFFEEQGELTQMELERIKKTLKS
ncbi:MAG: hypothetical protein AAF363_11270 [Bacteroidota bacterium]